MTPKKSETQTSLPYCTVNSPDASREHMAQALHFFLRKMLISSRCKNTGIEQVPEDVISEAQRHDQTISPGRVEGSFQESTKCPT
jgi:hypothetical protein